MFHFLFDCAAKNEKIFAGGEALAADESVLERLRRGDRVFLTLRSHQSPPETPKTDSRQRDENAASLRSPEKEFYAKEAQ